MEKKKKQITTSIMLVIFFIFAICVQVSTGQVVYAKSNFDVNLEGWTGEGSGVFSYSPTGGNPGGFFRFDDTFGTGGDGYIIAPSKFLGDWSALDGYGELSWDHIILQEGGSPTILRPHVFITGPGGSAVCRPLERMRTYWRTFSVPIDREVWQVTSGNWWNLIADVREMKIRIEAAHNAAAPLDINGIDNVVLGFENILRADFNRDGVVNLEDFVYFASQWLSQETWF